MLPWAELKEAGVSNLSPCIVFNPDTKILKRFVSMVERDLYRNPGVPCGVFDDCCPSPPYPYIGSDYSMNRPPPPVNRPNSIQMNTIFN
jgi:hypothetical protein